MIARLRGLVASLGDGQAVIDVGGVGYLVFASRRTLDRLSALEGEARLEIETHVREDHIHLYGFADRAERDWFRLLISVQGVGGRHALAILSIAAPDQLVTAVAAQDKAVLTKADGVGPKLAGRIVTELKDKVGGIALGGAAQSAPDGAAPPPAAGSSPAREEAISALVNLGYGRAEAFGAVARVAGGMDGDATVERLIPAALKELVS